MRAVLIGLVALGLAAPSGSAETRARYGRSISASLLGKPAVFDPHRATTHAELAVADMIFDGLYRVDTGGSLVPELAASQPIVSEDKLEVVIPLRVGALFHDGSALSSVDVAQSLQRLKDGPSGWLLGAVDSIEASDEAASVTLRLRYADSELVKNLASPVSAVTQAGKAPTARRLNGTGPFRFRATDRKKREMRFRAFDKHHRGRAYIDTIRFRWHEKPGDEARSYEVGDLHVSFRGDVAFSGRKPKYETAVKEGRAAILSFIGFGRANPKLLGEREFRRALSLAMSRKGMKNLGSGERAEPTVRPDSRSSGAPRASASDLKAQLSRARSALSVAAGRVPALASPDSLNLEILVNRSRLDDIDVADKVLTALDKLGVPATIAQVSAEVFNKRVHRGACDLYIGQLLAPTESQRAGLAAAFSAGGDSWAKTAIDKGVLDLASAVSEFRRRLPIIPLYHRAVRAHYRTDVFGLELDAASQVSWADLFLFGSPKEN